MSTETLADALPQEMARVREVLGHYKEIGPAGMFGAAMIEQDLRASLTQLGFEQPDQTLRLHAETVIRNYDPCISCATHFLDFRVQRD